MRALLMVISLMQNKLEMCAAPWPSHTCEGPVKTPEP